VLTSAVAATAAIVGATFSRVVPAAAAERLPVLLGQRNISDQATRIERTSSGPALIADSRGPGVGVSGTSEGGVAVYGVSDIGKGVVGASKHGSGVEAESQEGVALRVRRGRVRFDGNSGVARIATGDTGARVVPAARLPQNAVVLLTPMADLRGRDLWYTRNRSDDDFLIHMSEPRSEPTQISWLVLG
jgi:hypothetical protein